jgi:hypothetical protein
LFPPWEIGTGHRWTVEPWSPPSNPAHPGFGVGFQFHFSYDLASHQPGMIAHSPTANAARQAERDVALLVERLPRVVQEGRLDPSAYRGSREASARLRGSLARLTFDLTAEAASGRDDRTVKAALGEVADAVALLESATAYLNGVAAAVGRGP